MSDERDATDEEAVAIPIDGILDLHPFLPREVGELVDAYLAECAERRIREVRLIHGKGTGALRRTVHARLRDHPLVASFAAAAEDEGGWGATKVWLK